MYFDCAFARTGIDVGAFWSLFANSGLGHDLGRTKVVPGLLSRGLRAFGSTLAEKGETRTNLMLLQRGRAAAAAAAAGGAAAAAAAADAGFERQGEPAGSHAVRNDNDRQ